MGRTIRSAKMNETTPPKLMPPFHKTAASGTFPIEHTNETTATTGPINGPHIVARVGCDVRKKSCQKLSGNHDAIAPAIRKPSAMSRKLKCQSFKKTRLIDANNRQDRIL